MVSMVNLSTTEYRGLSTDIKPEKDDNGSSFYEMDTGKTYYYDADNEQWVSAD